MDIVINLLSVVSNGTHDPYHNVMDSIMLEKTLSTKQGGRKEGGRKIVRPPHGWATQTKQNACELCSLLKMLFLKGTSCFYFSLKPHL